MFVKIQRLYTTKAIYWYVRMFIKLQKKLVQTKWNEYITTNKYLLNNCYVEEYADSDPCGLNTDLQPSNTTVEMDCVYWSSRN